MDEFSSALQHLHSVHAAQIKALCQQLEEEQRVRNERDERIETLQKANEDARRKLDQAKKKIKQQAKIIRELEEQRQNSEGCSVAASHADPSTPVRGASPPPPPPPSMAATTTPGPRLNQTCAALFESPAVGIVDGSKVSISETPARPDLMQTRCGNEPVQEVSGEKEAEKDYHRGESVETIPGDVIILDDVTGTGTNTPTHSSSNSTVEPAVPDRTEQSVPSDNKELQISLPSSGAGPIHMVYSHAHAYDTHVRLFGDRSEQSPKRSHTGRPLSLRDGGSNKVKWKEVNITASTTASSGNLSETKLPTSPDKMSSPRDGGSETASSSSSPEQTSPSLLRASNSPWKVQRSNSSTTSLQQQQQQHSSTPAGTSVDMTHSLFARTPATVDDVASSAVMTTPVSMLKSHIPQSDSQFSLDVSQSVPLSPELCTTTDLSHKPPTHSEAVKKQTTNDPEHIHSPPDPLSSGKKTPHSIDCSVVPITPGVPSVNKILSRQKRWMPVPRHGLSPVPERVPPVTSLRNVSGKRGQDQVESEDEDVLPQSKVHKLTSECDTETSHTCMMCEDETRLEMECVDSPESREDSDSAIMSPVILYRTATTTSTAAARSSSDVMSSSVTKEPQRTIEESSSAPQPHTHKQDHERLLEKAGLPTGYKYEAVIRKRADRDKLEGKACPECKAWYAKDDGIHDDIETHLRCTCRHKHLHLPPDEDSKLWEISFPSTEECVAIMDKQ